MAETFCFPFRDHLPLYAAGTLPLTEQQQLDAHLAACLDCRSELAFWRSFAGVRTMLDDSIPPDSNVGDAWAALWRALPTHPTDSPRTTPREQIHTVQKALMGNEIRVVPPPPSAPPLARARDHRRHPLLAVATVALIVALSATLFGVLGVSSRHSTGPKVAATAAPAACSPEQLRVTLPPNASLADLSLTSPRDGWAVGQIWDPLHGATPPRTLLARFHNCQWSSFGSSIPTAELTSVSMDSADDGWAVGTTVTAFTNQNADGTTNYYWLGNQVLVLHYTGGSWQQVSIPGTTSAGGAKLAMTSASSGWLLLDNGKRHTDPYTVAYAYTLLHFQGGSWVVMPMPFKTPSMILSDLASSVTGDCWLVGYDTGSNYGGIIAHYAAGHWQTWTGSIAGNPVSPALYSVSLSSPQNVWAFGTYPYRDSRGDDIGPVAYHFDGTTWSRVNLPAVTDAMQAGMGPSATTSGADTWAFGVGDFPRTTPRASPMRVLVLHCSGVQCQWEDWPLMTVVSVGPLRLYAPNQGFAIGQIYRAQSLQPVSQGILLTYDKGTWSIIAGQR